MLFRLSLALTALACLLAARPGRACSVCGCGDPLLAASDPAAITSTLRVQVDGEYLRMDAGTDGRPGFTDQLTQWSWRLNVVYRPVEALALTGTLPLVSKAIHTVGGGADLTASSLTGLGDVEVGARYALWTKVHLGKQRVQELAVSAGTSIPTGAHDATDADGALIDPHGQLGAGGWGPFAGLHYRFEQGDWTGFASVSYRLRTEASYADGSRYKYGDAALWSAHAQYRLWPAVALDLGIDGRYARADRATDPDGTVTPAVENTGGTVLSAAPGVYFNPAGQLWMFVRAQVPFYEHLFGQQDVKPTVGVGFQIMAL